MLLVELAGITLQAGALGANTLAVNGGSAIAIRSHLNPANNPTLGYSGASYLMCVYNGTYWLDMSQ